MILLDTDHLTILSFNDLGFSTQRTIRPFDGTHGCVVSIVNAE
jgi:hypothetical protein